MCVRAQVCKEELKSNGVGAFDAAHSSARRAKATFGIYVELRTGKVAWREVSEEGASASREGAMLDNMHTHLVTKKGCDLAVLGVDGSQSNQKNIRSWPRVNAAKEADRASTTECATDPWHGQAVEKKNMPKLTGVDGTALGAFFGELQRAATEQDIACG